MADLFVSTVVPCTPPMVKDVLHQQEFLAAFVNMQHPTDCRIVANSPLQQSTAHWTVDLPSEVPGLVKKLVGDAFSLELWIQTSPQGQLRLNAFGRAKGFLNADLLIHARGQETSVEVKGEVAVSAGFLSGRAARMARDEVIQPVLTEDLFPLLNEWCTRG